MRRQPGRRARQVLTAVSRKKKWDELLALPPHGSEVFIDGQPCDITEEEFRELCEPLGEIYEVRLMKDKDTKENKEFAFVTLTDQDATQHPVEDVQDREFKGRTLLFSLSQVKHKLFVRDVPKAPSEEQLRNIIQGKGPGVVNIEMFKTMPGRNCHQQTSRLMEANLSAGLNLRGQLLVDLQFQDLD